jgi:hypothetical protein
MERVIVESPYAGNVRRNVAYAKAALLHSLRLGEAPFMSHLLYTQVLDDEHPEERQMGIEAGLAWRRSMGYAAFYVDFDWSPGMRAARSLYDDEGFPYELRRILTPAQRDDLELYANKPYPVILRDPTAEVTKGDVGEMAHKLASMASYCVPWHPKDADLAGMLQCPKHDHRHGFSGKACPSCDPIGWAAAQEE